MIDLLIAWCVFMIVLVVTVLLAAMIHEIIVDAKNYKPRKWVYSDDDDEEKN